jgi:sugar lactone lactonase YvrE
VTGASDPRGAAARLFSAAVASERPYELAEGPVWDEARERVLWVDINAGHIHSGSLEGDLITPRGQLSFAETVGAVACSEDGQLLVAAQRDLYRVRRGARPEVLAAIIPADRSSRLNDGACDPAGRFLVGSLALDARECEECLYRLGQDGSVAIIDGDLTLSNGLAWSPDGSVLYSVDTTPGVVWERPYDAATGGSGARSAVLRLGDGSPDGLCVDTDGNLWLAIWGAGEVRCYSPAGDRLATVTVPAPHTSSVAFVGPARDILLITTARDQLSSVQLDEFPLSGHLFVARVEATGVPTTPWRPS